MKKYISLTVALALIMGFLVSTNIVFGEEAASEGFIVTLEYTTENDLGWVITNNVDATTYKAWYDNERTYSLDGMEKAATIQTKRWEPASDPHKTLYKGNTTDIFANVTVNNSCEVYILTGVEPQNACLKWMITEGYVKVGRISSSVGDSQSDVSVYKKTVNVKPGETAVVPLGVMNSNQFNQMFSVVIKWLEPEFPVSVTSQSSGVWTVKPDVQIGDKAFTDKDYYYNTFENSSYPNRHGIDYYGLVGAEAIMTSYNDLLDPVCGSLSTGKVDWAEVTIGNSAEVYVVSPALEDTQGRYMNWLSDEGYEPVLLPNGEHAETVINIGWNQKMYLYKKVVIVPEGETASLKLGKAGPESWLKPMYTVLVKWIKPYEGAITSENTVSYSYDEEQGKVVITIDVSITSAPELSGYPVSYVLTDEVGNAVAESEASFDENGDFVLELVLDYVPGKYTFKADSYMLKESIETEIEVFDYADMIILLEQLKSEEINTAEALLEVIDDENRDLKLDKTLYSEVSREVRLIAADQLIYALSEYTVDEFKSLFAESLNWAALNSGDAEMIKAALSYSDESVKELMCYGDYSSLESKDGVYEYVAGSEFENEEGFAAAFNEAVAVVTLKNISNKTQITGILEKYYDIFGYDVNDSEYKKYKTAVNSYIADRLESIENPEDIIDIIPDGIAQAKKLYSSNTGSGGGGGGGGGSSSRPSAAVSKVEVSKEIVNEVPEDVAFEENISFPDVSDNHWAKDSIISLAVKKIVSGNEAGLFKPDAEITRAEFVKIIVNAFGVDASNGEKVFDDVSENEWYFNYVSGAYKSGIIKGSEGRFNPSDSITRQDAFLIIYNVLKPESGEGKEISDAEEISGYALEAVSALVSNGTVSGYEDGSIRPKNKISRAEATKLICNVLDK